MVGLRWHSDGCHWPHADFGFGLHRVLIYYLQLVDLDYDCFIKSDCFRELYRGIAFYDVLQQPSPRAVASEQLLC